MTAKPSICYAAPGHTLVSTAGSARNILAVAEALGEWADVTVAFRSNPEKLQSRHFKVIEFEPGSSQASAADDVAARGLNPLAHLQYLARLRDFAERFSGQFDLVFEKGWRLSGYLCRELEKRAVPSVLVENDVRVWTETLGSPRSLLKFCAHQAAQGVARRASRVAPAVIAETEQLKQALIDCRGIDASRIHVVTLGVDHDIFRPADRGEARRELGIDESSTVFAYVGGMDQYHDLSPMLEAMRLTPAAGMEVHLVGDGNYRARYQALSAGLEARVRFHGQVPHREVPRYIAAADVCVAPYDAAGFYHKEVSFSTLKIPEYMACARPVISIPSGHIRTLVDVGHTGFLFDNEIESWRGFLEELPDRQEMDRMGKLAAESVRDMTWAATAKHYLEIASEIAEKPLYSAHQPLDKREEKADSPDRLFRSGQQQ